MRKKLVINFTRKCKNEDLLVDLVYSILKDLYNRNKFYVLDDVLIDENKYYFIFSGNIKDKNTLIKSLIQYIKIQNYYYV